MGDQRLTVMPRVDGSLVGITETIRVSSSRCRLCICHNTQSSNWCCIRESAVRSGMTQLIFFGGKSRTVVYKEVRGLNDGSCRYPFHSQLRRRQLARTATLEITITICVSKMSREDHSTIRTMDSASFLGIGSWEQGVQIVATDDCEIMLPTPALLAWTVLGRENSWNWFSAYPDPWSPLGVHHQSDHDWIGSRENSDFNGEDSDTNSSWSCSYLVPAARE